MLAWGPHPMLSLSLRHIPGDNTGDNYVRHAERTRLKNRANGHDRGAHQDGLLAPYHLADVEGSDRTEEAADGVD